MLALALSLLWPGAAALADNSFQHGPQSDHVKGLVAFVSTSTLRVQTGNGSVSVGLAPNTTVSRVVTGSAADLARGQQIDAQLTAVGSGVIKSIHIERPSSRTGSAKSDPRRLGQTRIGSLHPGLYQHGAKPGPSPTAVGGQIVSVGSNSIAVRSPRGVTTTYALSSNLSVTKTMAGRITDLAVGETVMAWVNHASGVAGQVTILSS